jgi:hypothetical protein
MSVITAETTPLIAVGVEICLDCDHIVLINSLASLPAWVPVIIGRGIIACNTPVLQQWWDGKRHHR